LENVVCHALLIQSTMSYVSNLLRTFQADSTIFVAKAKNTAYGVVVFEKNVVNCVDSKFMN